MIAVNDYRPSYAYMRQAIIWTNGGTLLIERLVTNFSEILIEIYTFTFKKIVSFCLGLNVLTAIVIQ